MDCSRKFSRLAGALKGLGLAAVIAAPASEAAASCGPPDSVYIASVCITAANFCPRGYMKMDGQLLAISTNSALFSLLGCAWGGDCRTSFALPDMRGRSPIGTGTGPGLTEIKLGQWRGAETHTLTKNQLAAHDHAAVFTPAGQGSVTVSAFDGLGTTPTPNAKENYLQGVALNPLSPNPDAKLYGVGTGTPFELGGVDFTGSGGTVTVGTTGESRPFSIQSPVMALTHCIATEGIYPPRT